MTTRTCVCRRGVVVVVVVLVASTCVDASSVLLHQDSSHPLLPEEEADLHRGLYNLSHTSPSYSALHDTEYADNGGFFLDEFEAVTRSDTLECPSANVITTRYKCQVRDQWVDCYRRHCCQGYNFVAGRCLPDSVDPCTQNFCEQKCSVYFGRVICTCFSGYRFSPENHKRGIQPVCLDIDECASRTGICQHECVNKPGSFSCSCRPGYRLRGDNTTCELESEGGAVPSPRQWDAPHPRESNHARVHARTRDQDERCSASCSSVGQMSDKIRSLEEKIDALSTAVRLYSFASGLPGPEGPPGPPGGTGPRGFPGGNRVRQAQQGPLARQGNQGHKGHRGRRLRRRRFRRCRPTTLSRERISPSTPGPSSAGKVAASSAGAVEELWVRQEQPENQERGDCQGFPECQERKEIQVPLTSLTL